MSLSQTDDRVTLVHGATFCVSGATGAIDPSRTEGVFHRDVRVLSRLAVAVDGSAPELLAAQRDGAATAHWVHAVTSDAHGSPTAVLLRAREVAGEVRERLTLRRFPGAPARYRVTVDVAADFADLLALKAGIVPRRPAPMTADAGRLSAAADDVWVTLEALGERVTFDGDGFVWEPEVAVGGEASLDLVIRPASSRDVPTEGWSHVDPPMSALEVVSRSDRWTRSVASALADLDGLRVEVPAMGLRYLGAGAPWFMALFGRDTLITAWESLLTGPQRAVEVLQALADLQGKGFDERTCEQPGRILHELRTGHVSVFGLPPGAAYYGSVDATPLFVIVLAEAHRWGAADAEVAALLPAARGALEWCVEHGDIDDDGFVEYVPDRDGLDNQGWKDSGDAMVHADGTMAQGAIALAEVQAYVYAAHLGLAELEERVGDAAAAGPLRARAARLRAAFAEAFWLPERSLVAMALDGAKRPLAVASSNMGHCLWSGILDDERAGAAAERLCAPDLSATWGLRTLASTERAYSPLSYHLGSIWPHDTAIGVAGIAKAGRADAAWRLVDGLLEAAESFGWRLPELVGGFDAHDIHHPVPYPVACSPQAWAAAVPLALLRTVLGIEPDVPAGTVTVAPSLPPDEEITVRGIGLGPGVLDLRVRGRDVDVLAAPAGLDVRHVHA